MVGTCEVANTPEYLVAEPIPAAQEKDSKPAPLKLVTPPKPFQRPTGTSASNCELRERERARPIRFQHAVDARDRAAAAEIGGERPQPQFAITEERIACLSQLPCPRIFPHSFLPMFKASDLTSDISVTQ